MLFKKLVLFQHTFFIQYGQSADEGNTAEIVKALFSRHVNDVSTNLYDW